MRTTSAFIERAWMALAHVLGRINTQLILALLYYLIFTSIGWLRRLARTHSIAIWAKPSRPIGCVATSNTPIPSAIVTSSDGDHLRHLRLLSRCCRLPGARAQKGGVPPTRRARRRVPSAARPWRTLSQAPPSSANARNLALGFAPRLRRIWRCPRETARPSSVRWFPC